MRKLSKGSGLRIIFVDEYSFLSQAHLSAMSRRCQLATQHLCDSFGKYHVVLVGDPRQHTPPSGTALAAGAAAEAGLAVAATDLVAPDGPDDDAAAECAAELETEHQGDGDDAADGGAVADPASYDGRQTFKDLVHVINLDTQQRSTSTADGVKLQRYAALFMGERLPTKSAIETFCDDYNSKYTADIDGLLHTMPHVVTQRQTARSLIDYQLSLRIASATDRRACVWLSQHTTFNGTAVDDGLQLALRRHGVGHGAKYFPAAFVFFPVRVRADMPYAC